MWMLDYLPFWVFHLFTLASIGALIACTILKLPYKPFAVLAIVISVFLEGGISNQEKWEAKVAEAKLEMAKKETASAESSVRVVTKYINKVEIVKERGDAIVKEIPKFISASADGQCVIPNGFVLLHDSASLNEVPDSTRSTNEGASEVKLSGVAKTVTENYTTYHQVAEQLRSLQEWIVEQQKIYNK